ncbi:MAG: thioredoxin family protein [Candidatus Levybacteria bacterium]|nr:thioredoxin family protein [Candidatus Levybacteria bacterium]
MKLFNVLIILFLIIITGGFVFFKDGFNNFQKGSNPSESSNSKVLMDRLGYFDYSERNLTSSQKNGKTVLFFAATIWCQTCQALEEEIRQKGNALPSDVTILKVDYDNDKIMNNKYRITSQHTLVVLDKNGKELKRWIGGNFDLLIQELQEI